MSEKVTTRDIARTISSRTGVSQIDATRVLEQFFNVVVYELSRDNVIALHGFGKFYNTIHKCGCLPYRGGEKTDAETFVVTNFKISKAYKHRINKHYKENAEKSGKIKQ